MGFRVTLLACALLAAACGGSGGRPAPPPDPEEPFEPPLGVEQRLDTDAPGAALSVFPRLAQAGERLYVVWYDRRDDDTDVYFNTSPDGGRTWGAGDVRLDTDGAGAAASNVPDLAAEGLAVHVAWEDTRGGLSQVRYNRTLDGGATWLGEDVRLDRGAPGEGSSLEVDVAVAGDRVLVVWQDDRDGAPDVYLNRSEDGGATWLADDVRLDSDAPGNASSLGPRLAVAGETVLVTWADARDGAFDIRANRSEDGGATWRTDDVRLDTDAPGTADSTAARPVLDASRAVVVWEDARDGLLDVRANVSEDGGRTWLVQDVRLDTDAPGAADSLRPVVAASGALVLVAWEDRRHGLADIRVNRSTDGGRTWLADDLRLDTDPPGTARSLAPAVALGPSRAFVTWADDRKGRFDVLLSASGDGGLTWSSKETRLDTDAAGASNALAPQVVAAGDEARVVFYDDRDGPGDVYANRAAPLGGGGPGGAGDGAIR